MAVPIEQFQPALFPPSRTTTPDLRVELLFHLSHDSDAVLVSQEIRESVTGELVSMGGTWIAHGFSTADDAAEFARVIVRAAMELHGPF